MATAAIGMQMPRVSPASIQATVATRKLARSPLRLHRHVAQSAAPSSGSISVSCMKYE